MDEQPYSNREIEEKWEDIANALSRIEIQTTTTNGSVANVNRWRERVNGALTASGVFMAFVVVPILAWSLYVLVNIQQTVHQSVDEALASYNVNPTK